MAQMLGPGDGTLTVRTGKTGAAAMAGHNLLIEGTSWQGTLDLDAGSMSLTADAGSMRVLEGTGGIQALGDDEKVAIKETIDKDVLKCCTVAFESSSVARDGDSMTVGGVLELLGTRNPLTFAL